MSDFSLSEIHLYPLKSAAGIALSTADVQRRGLRYDRHWALFDPEHKVITAREYPELLALQPAVTDGMLTITTADHLSIAFPFGNLSEPRLPVQVFDGSTEGRGVSPQADAWFSDYLGTPCRLVFMDGDAYRPVLPKYGGSTGDEVSYADEAPLLLLSEASLADLNSRLEEPVSMAQFRPNLVVSGCEAYAEEGWKRIRIGACEFEIIQTCKRCVLATIDPVTRQKHPRQEPNRTLATYKRHPLGGVSFGVHLAPRRLGRLHAGDEVFLLG